MKQVRIFALFLLAISAFLFTLSCGDDVPADIVAELLGEYRSNPHPDSLVVVTRVSGNTVLVANKTGAGPLAKSLETKVTRRTTANGLTLYNTNRGASLYFSNEPGKGYCVFNSRFVGCK